MPADDQAVKPSLPVETPHRPSCNLVPSILHYPCTLCFHVITPLHSTPLHTCLNSWKACNVLSWESFKLLLFLLAMNFIFSQRTTQTWLKSKNFSTSFWALSILYTNKIINSKQTSRLPHRIDCRWHQHHRLGRRMWGFSNIFFRDPHNSDNVVCSTCKINRDLIEETKAEIYCYISLITQYFLPIRQDIFHVFHRQTTAPPYIQRMHKWTCGHLNDCYNGEHWGYKHYKL